jgi:hypothetical protein
MFSPKEWKSCTWIAQPTITMKLRFVGLKKGNHMSIEVFKENRHFKTPVFLNHIIVSEIAEEIEEEKLSSSSLRAFSLV